MHNRISSPLEPTWLIELKQRMPSLKSAAAENLWRRKNQFLDFLWKIKDLSPNTIQGYSLDLERFLDFFNQQHKKLEKFNATDFETFIESQWTQNRSPRKNSRGWLSAASRRRLVSALLQFFKYLRKNGLLQADLAIHLTTPKAKEPEPTFLRPSMIIKLLNAPQVGAKSVACRHIKPCNHPKLWPTQKESLRDLLFIRLLYSTGMRISEMALIRLQSINLKDGAILITKGKGGKSRTVYASEPTLNTLKEFLEFKPKALTNYLFFAKAPTVTQQRVFRNFVNRRLKLCARQAGIEKDLVFPHVMRHSFATNLLANGADVRHVQEALGHKHLSTTQRYTHVVAKEVKETVKRYHTAL